MPRERNWVAYITKMVRREAGGYVADLDFAPDEAVWLATIILKCVTRGDKRIHLYLRESAKPGCQGMAFVDSK